MDVQVDLSKRGIISTDNMIIPLKKVIYKLLQDVCKGISVANSLISDMSKAGCATDSLIFVSITVKLAFTVFSGCRIIKGDRRKAASANFKFKMFFFVSIANDAGCGAPLYPGCADPRNNFMMKII